MKTRLQFDYKICDRQDFYEQRILRLLAYFLLENFVFSIFKHTDVDKINFHNVKGNKNQKKKKKIGFE